MTKRRYFELCMRQSVDWLLQCAAAPSDAMWPIHIAIVRLAIRRKSA